MRDGTIFLWCGCVDRPGYLKERNVVLDGEKGRDQGVDPIRFRDVGETGFALLKDQGSVLCLINLCKVFRGGVKSADRSAGGDLDRSKKSAEFG